MDAAGIAREYQRLRPELTTFLTRLVVRADVAEELAQTVAVKALEAVDSAPADPAELRPWLFRIASNLAIDERRRHGSWRESLMLDAREVAEGRPEFVEKAVALRGSPEVKAIAREHLVVCFSCTLGQLGPEQAVSLLLKEVYGFTTEAVADIVRARFAQVKNWIQEARSVMAEKYNGTCALIRKGGVCHQCVELDEFFGAGQGNPLAGTDGSMTVRLKVLQNYSARAVGPWHAELMQIFGELN
ncbi:MAG TPA: RNA polymerase sigma factor [Myxococcales bacterium]